MLVRHAGWQFRLLVITADYCVDGDSRSETSIHLDVYCRRASAYVFSVSAFWIFARQFVWQVRGVGSFKPTPLEFGRVHCRGARFLDYRHSTSSLLPPCECLPFFHARMDRRMLNAELHVHRSLHWTRILRLDSTCLRRSLSLEDCLFRAAFDRR